MNVIAKVMASFLLIICSGLACTAQDKLRRVEQPSKFTYPNTPIEVLVNMDGKPVPSREVHAGTDWLRKLSLEVINVSNKDVKWLLINLTIREPVLGVSRPTRETAGIVMTFELPFSEPSIRVLPAGARVTLKPPPQFIDYWMQYSREQGIEDIEKVILDIRQVGFTDGTGWYRGIQTPKDPEPTKPPLSMLISDVLSFFLRL